MEKKLLVQFMPRADAGAVNGNNSPGITHSESILCDSKSLQTSNNITTYGLAVQVEEKDARSEMTIKAA